MKNNDYIDNEAITISNNIEEFIVLSKKIGIKTSEDAEMVCKWYNLKILLEKKGLIQQK